MIKIRAQILSTDFLFAAGTPDAVFAIGNEDYAVSVGVGYLVLKGVEFVELGTVEICRFPVFKHKNISLYNVYIVLQFIKEILQLNVGTKSHQ